MGAPTRHAIVLSCVLVLFPGLCLSAPPARSADGARASIPEIPPVPVPLRPLFAPAPPVINGDLSDPVWRSAPHFTGFITYVPDFDIVPKEQTDVALAY